MSREIHFPANTVGPESTVVLKWSVIQEFVDIPRGSAVIRSRSLLVLKTAGLTTSRTLSKSKEFHELDL
jgi:hypothetical protein